MNLRETFKCSKFSAQTWEGRQSSSAIASENISLTYLNIVLDDHQHVAEPVEVAEDHVLLRLDIEQVQLGVVHQSRENKQLVEYLAVGYNHCFVLLTGSTDCLA